MRYLMTLFILIGCLTGCTGPRYSDFFLYRDDGTVKPKVVFLPVRATDPEEERAAHYFDESLRWLALDSGELYFYGRESVKNQCDQYKLDCPIRSPLSFRPADFVVQVEVLEDAILSPEEADKQAFIPMIGMRNKSVLRAKLRVEVIDIRNNNNQTILFEVLEKSQVLSNRPAPQCGPVTLYEELAHQAIERIEDVIRCAR